MKWLLLIALLWQSNLSAQQRITESEELGMVHWYRDYDEALSVAHEESKPVFILFQEVPGCSTCRNYGHDVLSHPLVVEAIETYCIPLAIYNNKGGTDRKVLDLYSEPTWNNPVVRIVDSDGNALHPRIAGDYSAKAVLDAIIKVLDNRKVPVPDYINLARQELVSTLAHDYYQMYCFWSGEQVLGQIDGVVDVQSGFMRGAEVVKVTYDRDVTSMSSIKKVAAQSKIKHVDATKNYKVASNDVHYYLRNSDYRYLPLSSIQQTKVNSALGAREDASRYLSLVQVEWLDDIRKGTLAKKVRYDQDFAEVWWAVDKALSK